MYPWLGAKNAKRMAKVLGSFIVATKRNESAVYRPLKSKNKRTNATKQSREMPKKPTTRGGARVYYIPVGHSEGLLELFRFNLKRIEVTVEKRFRKCGEAGEGALRLF